VEQSSKGRSGGCARPGVDSELIEESLRTKTLKPILREESTDSSFNQLSVTVSVGICSTVELDNTLSLVKQIQEIRDPLIDVTEIIVATPNRLLAEKLREHESRLTVLLEERREGKVSALNKIIGKATGSILVFLSADVKMAVDAIPRLVKALVYHEDWGLADSRVQMGVGGALLMDRINSLLWAIHNATLDDLDSEEKLAHAGDMLAVRRELVDSIPNLTNDDAHVALEVRRKGFKVKRIPKSLVWITGPRSPTDYMLQRSRILRGHFELIRDYGTIPTTFEFSISSRPLRNAKLLFKTLSKLGPSFIPVLIVAGLLELFSLQIAIIGSFRKEHKPWTLALTTKRV